MKKINLLNCSLFLLCSCAGIASRESLTEDQYLKEIKLNRGENFHNSARVKTEIFERHYPKSIHLFQLLLDVANYEEYFFKSYQDSLKLYKDLNVKFPNNSKKNYILERIKFLIGK